MIEGVDPVYWVVVFLCPKPTAFPRIFSQAGRSFAEERRQLAARGAILAATASTTFAASGFFELPGKSGLLRLEGRAHKHYLHATPPGRMPDG